MYGQLIFWKLNLGSSTADAPGCSELLEITALSSDVHFSRHTGSAELVLWTKGVGWMTWNWKSTAVLASFQEPKTEPGLDAESLCLVTALATIGPTFTWWREGVPWNNHRCHAL